MQGSEARDALLAQIFGCGALLRTGKVQEWGSVDAMTTMLLAAAAKKAFLREVAAEVLLDMLGATPVQTGQHFVPWIVQFHIMDRIMPSVTA